MRVLRWLNDDCPNDVMLILALVVLPCLTFSIEWGCFILIRQVTA